MSSSKQDFFHFHSVCRHSGVLYHIGSMYGIFAYIWLTFMVNVGKCTIDGFYGYTLELIFEMIQLQKHMKIIRVVATKKSR